MVYGISGGPMEQFREGWAIVAFTQKPHYWKRRDLTHVYDAMCGFMVDQSNYHPGARVCLEPGVFMEERCKKCRSALLRPKVQG